MGTNKRSLFPFRHKYKEHIKMCKAPIIDTAAGVGGSPRSPKRGAQCLDALDDSVIISEELLKQKNTELAELQAMLLSVKKGPRRKELQRRCDQLDKQIKKLQPSRLDIVHNTEVTRVAIALSDSISTDDAEKIATALQALVQMTASLSCIDDVALFYLIGAGEGVVTAMELHATHTAVVAAGCHALCNLFAGLKHLNGSESITQQLCTSRTGDIVLRGMGEHVLDRDVQHYGCRVINVLAVSMNRFDDNIEESVATACFLTSARIAASKARRQHPEDGEVTQWADCAMRLL